ncbi:MAG: hypothetical protein ACYDDF_09555 [Thermoplasmatota archaeon]
MAFSRVGTESVVPARPSEGPNPGPAAPEGRHGRLTVGEIGLRMALVLVIAVGPLVAFYQSLISGLTPAIPYKIFPDIRPVLIFGVTAAVAGFAAFGPGRRRGFLVAYLLALHGAFAVDLSTIHWIATVPGPLGGMRADPGRLLAAVTGLAAAFLLQGRIHAARTWRDAVERGVPPSEATMLGAALQRASTRTTLLTAGAAIAAGLLVDGASGAIGDDGSLPLDAALIAGALLLAVLLAIIAGMSRPARA